MNEKPLQYKCTAEAACHLDAIPYLAREAQGLYSVRCDRCNTKWWSYRTPREQIRLQSIAHQQVRGD